MSSARPPLYVVILAAGKGRRMGAPVSKVMLPLCGKPILQRTIDAAASLRPAKIIIVVGGNEDEIRGKVSGPRLVYAKQRVINGNAGAVKAAMPLIPDRARVLALFGDGILTPAQLRALAAGVGPEAVSIRLLRSADGRGYSRFLRDAKGRIVDLVPEKSLTPAQRKIEECDAGGQGFPAAWARRQLGRIKPHAKGGELYLTELIGMAAAAGMRVNAVEVSAEEGVNINAPANLLQAEAHLGARLVAEMQRRGVLFADPNTVVVRGDVSAAKGAFIDRNVILAGRVVLKAGAVVGANCMLEDTVLGPDARLEPFTQACGAVL
ncbi:MAG: NTP transferase domain-containing protein, partial [Betaproteobacteria bacterium AqS2]|nr:NTP transferase domain-containing protein [Betaproteobacteria bacterium AqS2]